MPPWAWIAAGRAIICSTNHRPSTTKAGTLIVPMKMKKPIKYADVGAGPDQDIGSDHAANSTGSADQGNLAGRIHPCMGERPNAAAYQVEEQIAEPPHGILDVVAVKPEEPHVSHEVHQPAMREHTGEQRGRRGNPRQFAD